MFRQVNWLALSGLVMLAAGAFIVYSTPEFLPLWVIWLVGPLLGDGGGAVTVGGIAAHFFIAVPKRKRSAETTAEVTPILHLERIGRRNAPAGIEHEIPSMGGFIW